MQTVPTIEDQAGWQRPSESALCQDTDALALVSEFNYDLNDADFVAYFEQRTGMQLRQCECGFDDVVAVWANPWSYPASEYDIPLAWQTTRAKLQDCWELYVFSL